LKNLKTLDNVRITLDERKDAERIAVKISKFIEILKQNLVYINFLTHIERVLKMHKEFSGR
jgi:hypothetical protein